jgi:hypothetical protein
MTCARLTARSRNLIATRPISRPSNMDLMNTDTEVIRADAQQVLDDLFEKNLIPFRLHAREVKSIGMDEFVIRFHDSRLRSIDVTWKSGESFKKPFRVAILGRIERISGGPYTKLEPKRATSHSSGPH